MTNSILKFAIISGMSLSACNFTQKSKDVAEVNKSGATDVPFKVAKNYFVKNTYKAEILPFLKIETQTAFDSIFGIARTAGEQGKPTPIDFSKEFCIAVIANVTNKSTNLIVKKLNKTKNLITLEYSQEEGESMTYMMQPSILLIVDNLYKCEVKLQKE